MNTKILECIQSECDNIFPRILVSVAKNCLCDINRLIFFQDCFKNAKLNTAVELFKKTRVRLLCEDDWNLSKSLMIFRRWGCIIPFRRRWENGEYAAYIYGMLTI